MPLIVIIAGVLVVALAVSLIAVLIRGGNPSSTRLPQGRATMADVERLVQANQLIEAIKCYREIRNCGLAEAKTAVEQIRDRIKPK